MMFYTGTVTVYTGTYFMHTGVYCWVHGIRLFLFLKEQINDIIHSGRPGGIYIIRVTVRKDLYVTLS